MNNKAPELLISIKPLIKAFDALPELIAEASLVQKNLISKYPLSNKITVYVEEDLCLKILVDNAFSGIFQSKNEVMPLTKHLPINCIIRTNLFRKMVSECIIQGACALEKIAFAKTAHIKIEFAVPEEELFIDPEFTLYTDTAATEEQLSYLTIFKGEEVPYVAVNKVLRIESIKKDNFELFRLAYNDLFNEQIKSEIKNS